jgi:type VI secretion system protein ImpF
MIEIIPPLASRREVREAFRRDLEALLNARVRHDPIAPPEVQESIVFFGIRDYTTLSLQSVKDRDELLSRIARSLATFEPRLRDTSLQMHTANAMLYAGFRLHGKLSIGDVEEDLDLVLTISAAGARFSVKEPA